MTISLQEVNELIASLESAGELSIRETKVMAMAKAFKQLAAENVAIREQSEEVYAAGYNHGHLNTVDGIAYADCVKDDFYGLALQVMAEAETPATDRIVAGIMADGVEEFLKGSQLPYQIATVLADRDGVDDATLSTVIWSGHPPEPEGDVWHIEYVSRGDSIVREMLKQLREGAK
ncbi:TPA: hypothetical protein MJE31_10550 [Klebsiella pneumoniae]|uniref:hypothetical protein n=1 Tax=Klebsiella pneumoniae TaxID=573 RepID=UPI0007CC353B|nr:hypothetical protein [Klebsiella pneumoniae]ELC0796545.1 hypothetical protein [Klebsiella pneumoniae]ELH4120541.1 hypothetical protein [Klebsiella pneumoniae]EMF2171303.1 hypothetical protein [Klebsiella pneumoniae]MBC4251642.1 hypothetical protein [Klebsiella pneumoniae]MCE0044928.1 hypothetical protein [Klebsiella pneumoniae]